MIKIQSTLGKKGIYMSKFRTHIGVILAMLLAASPVAIYSATAATGGPRDAYITLQSPFLDASNTSDARVNQQMADGCVSKGWFGTGLVFQVSFAPVGSTINLTYNVKDKNGKPLAFTRVNLRINKGYSEAASIVEVDGNRFVLSIEDRRLLSIYCVCVGRCTIGTCLCSVIFSVCTNSIR